MTAFPTEKTGHVLAVDEVAMVLSAMGQLMEDLRAQDLALQDALSALTQNANVSSAHLKHMQHIDLVTQTHDELARFLPELARCLVQRQQFDHDQMKQKLTLQSLRDQLLESDKSASENVRTAAGDLSLF